jgi:biopolymer transport protein ExbD
MRRAPEASVNMTPMIDMVFILLIFFIVTTSFLRSSAVDIDQPSSSAARPVEGAYLPLALCADGRVVLAERLIAVEDRAAIAAALRSAACERVLIQADRAAPTGQLLHLMDTCRAAGARAVDVAAERRP